VTLDASGTKLLKSDFLKRLVRNGAMTPTTALRLCCRQWVECTGFVGQCRTSLTVTDWNSLNDASVKKTRVGRRMLWIERQQHYHQRNDETAQRQCQRRSNASIDRHSWPGLDFSASIVACQKHSRFRRRRARYSWRLEYHAAVASDVFRRRDEHSNRLTSRLDCLHSPSNQLSDGRRRMVTVFADISLSRTDVISLLYSSAS